MNATSIEWVRNPDGSQGYTSNPMSGCKNCTPEGLCLGGLFPCYAWKLAHGRLKQRYLANRDLAGLDWVDGVPIVYGQEKHDSLMKAKTDPFYPRFWEDRLTGLHVPRKADSPKKGIFVCDMGDLFGDCIPRSWQEQVFNAIKANPDYRFYLLTKQPGNLIQWSPFPDNCWVGVTVTTNDSLSGALERLRFIEATVRYLSFEPLLGKIAGYDGCSLAYLLEDSGINWLIIGACTGTFTEMFLLGQKLGIAEPRERITGLGKGRYAFQPKIEWVQEIVAAADKAGIPVFLKDNLMPLVGKDPDNPTYFYSGYLLRQEMPK